MLLALGSAPLARAQIVDAKVSAPFVATNTSEFWNPPGDGRDQPQRIDLELVVLLYDPDWKLLWAQAADGASWFDTTGLPLPMKSGQRVRIQGTYVPAAGIDGKTVRVTVLADDALPPPLPVTAIDDFTRYDAHWVVAEGIVVRQLDDDSKHVRYDIMCQGRDVMTYLLLGNSDPVPQLVGSRVRMKFVYASRRDTAGKLRRVDGWIPHRNDISVIGSLDDDPRLRQPVVSIESVTTATIGEWVHLHGVVQAIDAGRSVTIRDGTSQVLIRTEQPLESRVGDGIEVFGRIAANGLNPTLAEPICRPTNAANVSRYVPDEATPAPQLKLRVAEQVKSLRTDESNRHYPVALRGVVTWSNAAAPFFFVQDSSGGVRIDRGAISAPPPVVGSLVAVEGATCAGPFANQVDLHRLDVLGAMDLPDANVATLEEAQVGAKEGQRVIMGGLLRSVTQNDGWLRLHLTTASGEFEADMLPDSRVEKYVGAIVRLTGVCTSVSNLRSQVPGVLLWIAPGGVQIEAPRLSNPFVLPVTPIANLRQNLAMRSADHLIHIAGSVLYDEPGRYFYIEQDGAGLLVLRRDAKPAVPGEWVDVVGVPGRDGNRVVLRDAVWEPGKGGPKPEPVAVDGATLSPVLDGRLAKVTGVVAEKIEDTAATRILLRSGRARLEVLVRNGAPSVLPEVGSLITVTGVYALQYDEYRQPRAFTILARGPADVIVLRKAPWWTATRVGIIAASLALCTVLVVGWVVVLRRRVRQQTAQIRVQLEKTAKLDAELERAARLESLGVLAGGIAHDFNNLLTVIIANLGLAAMDDRVQSAAGDVIAEAERGARRAADLTQQLLTFAKGGDPVRRAVSLPDVVRESAEFARHGSRVRCAFEIEPDLPQANVDRGQISRVVHNLVLNATQAMPEGGVIRLSLRRVVLAKGELPSLDAGPYVKLSVTDEGRGIPPEHLERIFEPYFSTKPKNNGLGLATVHSIVKKHQGHISVRSQVGQGTTFDIWLPVAPDAPLSTAPASAAPCATAALRVLFMDDDEIIRRTAATILHQLGHQAKIVADGMEVVREYEAALNSGQRYDVVVLDLTVPGGLGGRAAMEILRRIDPGVRGIVSSGYSNDPVLANFRAYGFCAVVPKPYVLEDFARAIQEVAAMKSVPPMQPAVSATVP